MRHAFGLLLAAGLLFATSSRADAQVAVSVGYPAYGYYGGFGGVSVNVPGFSFTSGAYYPTVYAAPVVTTYAPTYYTPTYYAPSYYSVRAPYVYTSGYYGYYPGVRVRVGY